MMYGTQYNRLTLREKSITRDTLETAMEQYLGSGGKIENLPEADALNPINIDHDLLVNDGPVHPGHDYQPTYDH